MEKRTVARAGRWDGKEAIDGGTSMQQGRGDECAIEQWRKGVDADGGGRGRKGAEKLRGCLQAAVKPI